jgi:ABC-type glycerol-3-phosphate transport system substrate-binding protein
MKISLFQIILIGIFGLGALIGLFVFATYSGSSSGSGTVGTVVIWGTLPEEEMKSAITTIAQNNKSIKNVSYVQKNESTLSNDLSTAIATGASPDLILASQENLHALAKFVTQIPSATLPVSTFTNTFIEEGNLFATADGYYGIPFLMDPIVLFSNRTILSSEGIAKPPATWEALAGLVSNVAILTPTRQVSRGLIALGTYDNVQNARGILSTLFLQAGVPVSSYSSSNGLVADLGVSTSNGTPPGQSVIGFYTQFADTSKVSYTWNASMKSSKQAFLAGDLALYLGYASEARYFTEANPNLNFIVTPVPQPATAVTKSTYGLVYAFMIPRGSNNMSGAYQAAVILTNSDEQSVAANATGLTPVTLNQLAAVPTEAVASVAYSEALYADGWISPSPSNADTVFSSMIGNVITGRSTLNSALTTAELSLTSLLQQ